jgi:hypothetical protein
MPGIWNQEWLNQNSQRAYPLSELATRVDGSGIFTLPDDFLLGLYIPVHSGLAVDPTRFYLHSVAVYATGYSVAVGYNDDAGGVVVGSATIAKATHREYDAYAIPGVGDFDDIVGYAVVGSVASIDLQPPGQYFFGPAGGVLEPDCIRPMIRWVGSITVVNGNESSPRIYGDIQLVAGDNMQITVGGIGDAGQIRFDAIDGAGLTEVCACTEDLAPPIRTINNVPPAANGDFILLGNDCLKIDPAGNGLRLSDECSQPCCGCAELEALTRELDQFGSAATTLQNFLNALKTEVDTQRDVILSSRLNTGGCVTC